MFNLTGFISGVNNYFSGIINLKGRKNSVGILSPTDSIEVFSWKSSVEMWHWFAYVMQTRRDLCWTNGAFLTTLYSHIGIFVCYFAITCRFRPWIWEINLGTVNWPNRLTSTSHALSESIWRIQICFVFTRYSYLMPIVFIRFKALQHETRFHSKKSSSHGLIADHRVNTLRLRQNGRQFPDGISNRFFYWKYMNFD